MARDVLGPHILFFFVNGVEKYQSSLLSQVFSANIEESFKNLFSFCWLYFSPIKFLPLLNSLFIHLFLQFGFELFLLLRKHLVSFLTIFFEYFLLFSLSFSLFTYLFYLFRLLYYLTFLFNFLLCLWIAFQIFLYFFFLCCLFRLLLFNLVLFGHRTTHCSYSIGRISDNRIKKLFSFQTQFSRINSKNVGNRQTILLEI